MKRTLFCLALIAALPLPNAFASNVDFNVGINIGTRPPAVAVPVPVPVPVPAPEPPPVYEESAIEFEEPPLFIAPPELGFHVAVGIPYDLFYFNNVYYLCRGNVWYASPYYQGPWHVARYQALPHVLRRHSYARIKYYRDAGYRNYRTHRTPYWQRHQFRPQRQLKQVRYEKYQHGQQQDNARRYNDRRDYKNHDRNYASQDSGHGSHR